MTTSIVSALSAYANTAARDAGAGMAPRDKPAPGTDFADLVKGAANDALAVAKEGETKSMQALAGKADLTDVVVAVTNAEVSLQTVVAIRDKVVLAYQEIIRMPL